MKIQDIYITPSNQSVVAHLQQRLREAWGNSPTYPNQEVSDVLDAIRICLKADAYPELHWDASTESWHA